MDKDLFITELNKLNINPTEYQLDQLDNYYKLLIEWNNKINFTTIVDEKEVYLKHFYDSLTIVKAIDLNEVTSLCDVGTGAGFPGIVIKIFFPQLCVELVDSLEKRIKFLNEVINKLQLKNINAIHSRVEDYAIKNRERFDVVTARAVTNLPVLLEYCIPLVKKEKYFIPLKANINEELEKSKEAMTILKIKLEDKIEFLLPIEQSLRTILRFKKLEVTNKKYPRKFAEIKKKSL